MPPAPRLLSWGGLGSQRLRSLPSRLANSPRLPAVELLVLVTPECVPFVPASSLRCPSLPILRVTPRGYRRTPCPWSRDDPSIPDTGRRGGLPSRLRLQRWVDSPAQVQALLHFAERLSGCTLAFARKVILAFDVCAVTLVRVGRPPGFLGSPPHFLRTRGAHTDRPRCTLPASRASSPVPGGSKSEKVLLARNRLLFPSRDFPSPCSWKTHRLPPGFP